MLVRFLVLKSISYMTKRKSALTFVQGQILNPYPGRYPKRSLFPSSFTLQKIQPLLPNDLLIIRLLLDSVGLTLLYQLN